MVDVQTSIPFPHISERQSPLLFPMPRHDGAAWHPLDTRLPDTPDMHALRREKLKWSRKSSDEFSKSNHSRSDVSSRSGRIRHRDSPESDSVTRTTFSSRIDIVYCGPRPIVFPYHNDGHFLPLAESPTEEFVTEYPYGRPYSSSPDSLMSTSTRGLLRQRSSSSFLGRWSPVKRESSWGRRSRRSSRSSSTSSLWSSSPVFHAVQTGRKKSIHLFRTLLQPIGITRTTPLTDIEEYSDESICGAKAASLVPASCRASVSPTPTATATLPAGQFSASVKTHKDPNSMAAVALGPFERRQRNGHSKQIHSSLTPSPFQPTPCHPFSFATTASKHPSQPPRYHPEHQLKPLPAALMASLSQDPALSMFAPSHQGQPSPHANRSPPTQPRPRTEQNTVAHRLWTRFKGFIGKSKQLSVNRVGVR